ncbi:MAG: 50S ribosomal protein L10 [Planctomycetota bacterium]|jgi:large subunit ribosomal protein L10
MPSRLKELILNEMTSRYRDAGNMIFVGYSGLSGGEIADFRTELRKEGVHLRVVRNRITVRAFAELGRPDAVKGLFDGPTAIMDGEDPVAMAKAAVEFAKRAPNLEVKGGVVEGEILDATGVRVLASMPSRAEMLSIIAGTVKGVGGRVAAAALGAGGRVAGAIKTLAEEEGEDASGSPEPQAA